jgi:hypothetical protein
VKLKLCILFLLLSYVSSTKAQTYNSKQIDSLGHEVLKIVDYREALKLSFKCYGAAQKIKYEKGKLDAIHNIIMIYYNLGILDKVIIFSDKLQEMAYAEGNYYEVAFTMHRKAFAFKAMLLQEKADQNIDEAVKIAKEKLKGDAYNLIMGDVNKYRGAVEMNKKKPEKGCIFTNKAMPII